MASNETRDAVPGDRHFPLVIGLYGIPGSGKSAVARQLVTEYGYTVVKFAGPLKDMLAALLAARGCDDEFIARCLEGDLKETPVHELNYQSPRHAMQTLGTEWGRERMCHDFWINAALDQIAAITRHGGRVVVDDLRFANEASALESAGAYMACITRPGATHNGHKAEGQLDGWMFDALLRNDGDLTDLAVRVRRMMDTASEVI